MSLIALQGYKVYYTVNANLPMNIWTVHRVDNTQLTTISNLLTNRTYSISVVAFTSRGDGPFSEHIQVKTQQGGKNINIFSANLG